MALTASQRTRLTRDTGQNNYASQHGKYGLDVRKPADGDSGTAHNFSCLRVFAVSTFTFRDVIKMRTHTKTDAPAGYELVGIFDSVEVTSGEVDCYYAGK